MVFSSYLFLFYFLPTTLLLYYLMPRRGRHLMLTLLSYAFYGWANPLFVGLLLLSTLVDYVCGLAIAHGGRVVSLTPPATPLDRDTPRARGQKIAVPVSICTNLSLLGFFKYFNFAAENFDALVAWLGWPGLEVSTVIRVTLPLGISFYTFQSMSYTLDVYRGHARALGSFVDFACYVSMFPQLVAGPIIRFSEVSEQLRHRTHTLAKRVITSSGDPWRAEASADVLLLGDSFSNIYSLETMGWGSGAGLAERLAFELQRPVDRIARNDNGAYAPRQALASELGRGRDRLASTRVVIYQFAARELSFGDWRPIELPAASTPSPGRFLTVPAGEARLVVGTILSASVVPRPGTVPYRDHIRSLHITAIEPADDGAPFPTMEAVVYVWSMRENEWTDAASYRPGDRVTLRIRGWDDVADDYGGVNRSELEDERLLLVEPVWGEADAPAPR